VTLIEPRWQAGLAALAAGTPGAAVELLREAAAAGEGGGFAALNLGLALEQLGRLEEAAAALEEAAAALPDHPEPWFRLGTIAGLRGEGARAETLLRAALDRAPGHVTALAALAALAEEAGRMPEAAALIARARAADPEEPELDFAEARLALRRGALDAAIERAEAVLARRPAHLEAAALWAEALRARDGEAVAAVTIAAREAADPLGANWALAAARLHAMAGRAAEALAELHAADALAPEDAAITAALGMALADIGDRSTAEQVLRAAIALRPNQFELRNRLATLLYRCHRYAEMDRILEEAIAAFGPEPTLRLNRALALNALGRQREALDLADETMARPGAGLRGDITRISLLAYHPEEGTGAALRAQAARIGAHLGPAPPAPARPRDPDRRLRVGLLSGGLGQHPVGWLTLAGLEALPAAEFELAAYSLKPREDWLGARYKALCATWRDMALAEDRAIAEMIRADGCDILLDLGGFGDCGRPGVMQQRPTPVQIKWVGSQFSTTGIPACDWMLTDRWETPAGFEPLYSERLLRLPDGYLCYLPAPYAPAVGKLPALARGHVTFGCFNNLSKVTPVVLRVWAEILAALPAARLVLRNHALAEAATREGLAARLAALGVAPGRVEMHGGVAHEALLAAYGEVDIALDPFPYTGGLTVCEALWMGVPVVALTGDSFCGRHALSHLCNVGLADWAVADARGYVARALAAAADLAGLAALRAGLRGRVAASPLVDAPRFGVALGAALRFAWRDWCATPAP